MGRLFFKFKIKINKLGILAILAATLTINTFVPLVSADIYKNLETPFYDPNSSLSGGCGTTSLIGSDSEQQTWNYFKSRDLSDEQTAGVMGNLQQESSFLPQRKEDGGNSTVQPSYIMPNTSPPHSPGWGLAQWTLPYQNVSQLLNQYNISGNAYDLATQLDLVWAQMSNTSPVGAKNMVQALKQISDPSAAATYFDKNFEGGSDPNGVRENNAVAILAKYKGTSATPSGSSGSTDSCDVTISSGDCQANSITYDAEYSQQQMASIFGDPGTASSHPAMDANLTNVNFLGHKVQANKAIAACLEAVANDIKSNNVNYQITSVGCYRFDSDNGSSNIGLKSYHTYGAACDINPLTNNYYNTGDNGTRPYNPNCPAASSAVNSGNCYDMSPQVVKIFAAHGFLWGGNFNSIKDYMHFEWHGVVP